HTTVRDVNNTSTLNRHLLRVVRQQTKKSTLFPYTTLFRSYNLFIFLGVRDNHYLAFVHYIFWVAVVQVAILGFFPRLIGSPILSNVKFVAFAGAMSGIASILFIKSFLNTKSLHRRVNWSLNTILLGDLIAIVLLIAGFPGLSYEIINFVAGLGSIVVLIIGFIALKNGNKSAKLFLIAWGIFLGSV